MLYVMALHAHLKAAKDKTEEERAAFERNVAALIEAYSNDFLCRNGWLKLWVLQFSAATKNDRAPGYPQKIFQVAESGPAQDHVNRVSSEGLCSTHSSADA